MMARTKEGRGGRADARDRATLGDYVRSFRGIRMPWLLIALVLVTTVLSTFAGMFVAVFTGDMVDASGDVPVPQLVQFALSYLAVGVLTALGTIFQGVASERINLGLRKKLWRKIIRVRQSSYEDDGGETLVSRVTTDCDYASKLVTTLVGLLSIVVSLVLYVSQMFALSADIAVPTLVSLVALSLLIGWGYAHLKYVIAERNQAMLSRSTTYLVERTSNLALVKTSDAQAREVELGRENFQRQYVTQVQTGVMNSLLSAMQTVYGIVSAAIPFAVGAGLVASGTLSVGVVVAFYSIAGSVGTYLTNVIDSAGTIRQANGALARVINTLKLDEEDLSSGAELPADARDLSLESVSFGYGERDVLSGLSCTFPEGEVTALIGANGSGKTTVMRLLDRLYDPRSGSVEIGGEPAASYSLGSWRRAFAVVPQASSIVSGTIRDNICYGLEREVSDDELMDVARRARVWDFARNLPDGLDARVSAGGSNLSGGQRQCVAIARAMMSDARYLLLDEATSNLDAKSERAVTDALHELSRGRTTVVIAHSLAAIRNADHVVVLDGGRAAATGTPAEVLARTDSYLAKIMGRRPGAATA